MSDDKNVEKYDADELPKLSRRHKIFADEYLRCYSPAKAARFAKYSDRTAASIGYQLMQREDIKHYIDVFMASRQEAINTVPFDIVVTELTEIALDPDTPSRERMKASDLLMKWKMHGKWGTKENAKVQDYVEAIRGQQDNTWDEE